MLAHYDAELYSTLSFSKRNSSGGGIDGILYIRPERQRAVSLRERRQGGAELEPSRQQLEREQPCAPSQLFSFLSGFCRGVLFYNLSMPTAKLFAGRRQWFR